MALSDTIDGLLERQRIRAAAPEIRVELSAAWARNIDGVMDLVAATLAPHVDAGRASVTRGSVELREDMLGKYSAQRLIIGIAGIDIVVEPVARFVFGASGRIDMYRDHRASEDDRLFILRAKEAGAGQPAPWLIETRGPHQPPGDAIALPVSRGSRWYLPLERTSIEGAVETLLTMT